MAAPIAACSSSGVILRSGAVGRATTITPLLTGTAFAKTRQLPETLALLLHGIAKGDGTARLARELTLSRRRLQTLRYRVQTKAHLAVHRSLSAGILALLAAWHHHRVAPRGQHLGRSPLQRSGLQQPTVDWLVWGKRLCGFW